MTKWNSVVITDAPTANEKAKGCFLVAGEMKACLLMNNLSGECHGKFKRSLANSYARGSDSYLGNIRNVMSCVANFLCIIQPPKAD